MSDRVRAIDCPSCGAPLEMPKEHQRLFRCDFCGTTLEDLSPPKEQKTGQKPKIVVHSTAISRTTTARIPPTTYRSKRTGWIILLLILGFVGASVIVPMWLAGEIHIGGSLADQTNRTRIYSFGLTRLFPSDNDTEPDIIGVTYNSDETNRMVYVDFDADPHLRWQSNPLGEGSNYTYNHVIADQTSIYMAYETTLVALNRQDGTIRWQLKLSDQVSHICQNCLQVFDNRVLALTVDGMLNGIDTQSGELAWSVRLNETPRQLINIGGRAGVLDEENGDVGINVYTPETGTLMEQVVPECPNDIFPDLPQTLGIYDPILITNDGKDIYISISGYDPGCLQKINHATLSVEWETQIPSDILEALDWDSYLLTEGRLYTSDGHNLFAVNLLDGDYQDILSDEDHNFIPLAEQNGILITLAESTRGTRKFSLWGISTSTHVKLWQFEPNAEDFNEDSSSVVYDEGLWSVVTNSDQTIIQEVFANPGKITFTVLNPMDGATLAENTFEINKDDSSFWMQIPGWNGERVYLEMDARLWLFDALTSTNIAGWP